MILVVVVQLWIQLQLFPNQIHSEVVIVSTVFQRQIDNGANFKGNINMNGTSVRTVKHRRSERSCHVRFDRPFIDDVWGLQPWTIYVCAADFFFFFGKIWSIEIHSGLQHDSIGGCFGWWCIGFGYSIHVSIYQIALLGIPTRKNAVFDWPKTQMKPVHQWRFPVSMEDFGGKKTVPFSLFFISLDSSDWTCTTWEE